MVLEVIPDHCCGKDWNFSLKLSAHHKYAKKSHRRPLAELLESKVICFESAKSSAKAKNSVSYL